MKTKTIKKRVHLSRRQELLHNPGYLQNWNDWDITVDESRQR